MDDYHILSLDPGGYTTGMAVSSINADCMTVQDAWTAELDKMAAQRPIEYEDDRTCRLAELTRAIYKYAAAWNVSAAFAEFSFLNHQRPMTYAALMEAKAYIQNGLWLYDPTLTLYGVDPPRVKVNVGVNGKSNDKAEIRAALYKLPDLKTCIDFATLDEHAIDAIAVGYYFYKTELKASL